MPTFDEVIPILNTLSIVAMVLVFWRQGASKASADTIVAFKGRIEVLESDVERLKNLDLEKTAEIAKLRGILEEKERNIKSLTEIMQNRNPEMVAFIEKLSTAVDQTKEAQIASNEYMKMTREMLEEIHTFMSNLDNKMTASTAILHGQESRRLQSEDTPRRVSHRK